MIGDVVKFGEEEFQFIKTFVGVMIEDKKIGNHSMVHELLDCVAFLLYDCRNEKSFLFNLYKKDFDELKLPDILNGIVERLCDETD